MGVNRTPTRQHRDCDLNSGPTALEFSTLTTRLPSHPAKQLSLLKYQLFNSFESAILWSQFFLNSQKSSVGVVFLFGALHVCHNYELTVHMDEESELCVFRESDSEAGSQDDDDGDDDDDRRLTSDAAVATSTAPRVA